MLGAAALVSAATVAAKVFGLFKELALAYRFGIGDALDAFLLASLLPMFLVNVVASPLSAAFLPLYLEVKERAGNAEGERLLAAITVRTAYWAAAVTLVGGMLLPILLPHFATGFSPAKIALSRALSIVILPIVVLNVAISLWTAVLNAHERYLLAALSPAAVPAGILGALVTAGPNPRIQVVGFGLVAGTLLQCTLLGLALRRLGVRLSLPSGPTPVAASRLLGQYIPAVGGACLMAGSMLIDQIMAAMLPGGSVSALNYGNKLVALIVGFGTAGLGSAVLPHFGRMAARRDWLALRRSVRVAAAIVAVIAVPMTGLLIVLSPMIVRIIYQRGAFSATDAQLVAEVQSVLLLQAPFNLVGMLFVRLIAALQRNSILFWGAAVSLSLNVVLNYLFMQRWGIVGIALSTSAVYTFACMFLGVMSWRALGAAARGGEAQ